ncbi:LOW QUALITY PROTEIN: dynein axonemal heavy chain 10-like [Palaemon carinicauda]|uniref:LOW QUALITY PROTEIN: dynein axonemal heavy chain 10-like n=1 Tax=Palaemon carinicauda TaxID=392227 RepID=UPI0035B64602
MSAKSKASNETTEDVEVEVDEEEEEEEDREVDDGRVWWIGRKVSEMLRFALPSLTPSLTWPQHPDLEHHHIPLRSYMRKRATGTGLQQMLALKNENGNIYKRDGVIEIAENVYAIPYNSDIRNNFPNRNHKIPELIPKVTVGGVKKALKDKKRGESTGEIGYLDEAKEGSLLLFWHPDADDEEKAEDGGAIDWDEQAVGAPFSSAAGTTTFSWKFDDVDQGDEEEDHGPKLEVETYIQAAGDGPRLQVLEGGFSPDVIGQASVLVKKVTEGSVPLVTNTKEANAQMPNHLHLTYFHRQTHFVLHDMFNSEVKDPTLGDLRQSWTDNYLDLSASLSFVQTHPGYVYYLVVGEGRLEALGGHAAGLLEVLEFIWRLGKKDGISGRVQIILDSAVQSLVELVTQELRPVNLLPSNMREPIPLLTLMSLYLQNSQSRVKSALAIVEEWESVITRYGDSINQCAKRQRDGRQDFDPCRVLSTIASVRSICEDLDEIMKILLEAQTGFSGEWSALIRVRDPDQLKNITSQVLKVLTAYDFNIFSPRNYDRWVRQKDDFQLSVQKWEQAVVSAIHESFKDRLTSELVTAVAGVLGKQPCRTVFRELLISRLPDLLSAFATEVKGIRADFQAQQKIERPGTQAPLSGRVRWMATYLTKRLAAWTTLKDLYSQYQGSSAGGELWAEVGAEVEEVQHEVEGARAKMVTGWSERVTQQIPKLLVTPVLSRNPDHKGPGGWQVQLPGELQWIVWESGQLLQTGIKPPELAVHLTLHYQTLQTAAMSLHLTLNDYHAVLSELSPVQRELLRAELAGAERVLAAGQRVVTWSPAALTHFSASCKDVIEHVRALANKLMSITHRLEDYLATIQRTNLMEVTPGPSAKKTPSLMELMEVCSDRRDEVLEVLEETYEKLVTTLGSAGLLLDGAEEGAPEQLAIHIRAAPDLKLRLKPFLEHWRHNVKEAIILMMVGSIQGFEEWLKGDAVLFGVEANLSQTGLLTLSPAPNTLATNLADSLGQTVRCAMSFRHWAELDDGTAALDAAPTADDDTLAATTFYSQISTDPRLHDAVDNVQKTFAKVIHKLDRDLQKWYAYEHVWKRDKRVTVTRFCSGGPSVKQYDDKLRFYTHLSTELAQATGQLTHGCVNLNVRGLVKQVVKHIDEWMKLLGQGLLQEARSKMQHVLHQITTINRALQKSPDDLTALTVVMKGVGQVSSEQAHLHTALLDVSQMFHTLQVYGIEVPRRDYEQLDDTSARLEVLHQTATGVQKAVEPVQQLFLTSTQRKIEDFSDTVREFHKRFEEQGPGSVGEDLERGVVLLKEYSVEVEELLKIRRALDEEEDIFDLAATQYPGLDNAIHVLSQTKGVFAIYQKLRTIETTWKTMRWPTAKLDELKHQVEGIQKDLAECEGSQDTEVGRSLHQRLQDHSNSLEVTAALRQSAVQPRHWQNLVASAGCKADWVGGRSMSSVSVWDVLELRLSRHPLMVATTVAVAIKENILNNHLINITNCWQHARLTIVTASPLWYVDGVDDLLQHLHHHNLALKTLRSTKYCRPFEVEASRLAKTLVKIEDLLETWKSTQSRVMLLLSAAVSSLLDTSVLKVKHRQLIERTERRPMILELSANEGYVQEVSSLKKEASILLRRLSQCLSKPRRQCSRLYLLTDHEMTRLLAEPSCKLLSEVSYKLFNNVVAMKWVDTFITGVVSIEGEQLDLTTAVNIAQVEPNASDVGTKVQKIIDHLNLAMRKAMKCSIEDLGRETRLYRSLLQEQPVAAVTVAWRVWWAAGVDVALHKRAKGNRETLRQVLQNVNEDIDFLFEAMGRGPAVDKEEEVSDHDEEGTAPLSSVRTSSRLSTRTARRPQPAPLPPERCLSLLVACVHARDIVATLIRENTSRTDAFAWISHLRYSWQKHHSSLLLHAAQCNIEYGYEYSGCGNRDYVLTPSTERCILAVINAITAHTPPILVGTSGCGRQSLLETAAHLAARFITSFTMSKLTSATTLKILLTGTVIGGWWTVFRDCVSATPTVLSTLASTLLAIHQAHSHATSTPVIQISGEEVRLHPSAGIILTAQQFPSEENEGKNTLHSIVNGRKVSVNGWKLPHSMETLTRPIRVTAPPINTLIFAWLQASAVPKAQEVSDVVAEVLRQVMESYRTDVISSLRIYMRLAQQVMSTLSSLQNNATPVEAAAAAFRKVMVPLVPKKSIPAVDSVLDLLKPEDDPIDSNAEAEKESDKVLKETILRQLNLTHIPEQKLHLLSITIKLPVNHPLSGKKKCQSQNRCLQPFQMESVNNLINELDNWGSVVVVGPPRSGKSSVIWVATRFMLQREGQQRFSDGYAQSPSDALRSSSLTEGQPTPLESKGREAEVEFLQTDRELADRFVFALRPNSYSTERFYGNSEGDGLFASLLQHLAWKRCRSFVVLEGKKNAECLLRMKDLPGTLVLESLKTLQSNGKVTFLIEVCSTEEVPEWVLGRSAVVQISRDTLRSSGLLPSADTVPVAPSTTSTARQSRTSQTPRTASKPNTPIPEDTERLSPPKIREYLLHRLLQPVLDMINAGVLLHSVSAVDILEQVNFLSRMDVNELHENDNGEISSGSAKLRLNDQLGSVPLLVQAALQVSRAVASATQLQQLQEEIGRALKKIGNDGVLSSADKEVIQSLSSCGGAAFDYSWDLASSSWKPWLLVGEEEVDAKSSSEVGYQVTPTRDARRLSWLIGKMSQIYRPLLIVGGPASGKTTTALQALASLNNWRKIRVSVTCTTTSDDLEDAIISQVTRKSFDTLIPDTPTIFLLDDLGSLPKNSRALSFLQGLVLHKGLFVKTDSNKWMNLNIVGIASYYGEKWAFVEGVEKFSGWTIYNMDSNEDAYTFFMSSALTPISSLQSQVVSTIVSMTEAVAQTLQADGVFETSKGHAGIGLGIAIIVDALRSLTTPLGTHQAPFLLLVGPLTRDKEITLSLAATYVGMTLKTGELADQVLELIDPAAPGVGSEDSRSTDRKGNDETPSLILYFTLPAKICIRHSEIKIMFPIPRYLQGCLKRNKRNKHQEREVDVIKDESLRNQEEIADFVAQLHLSYCSDDSSKSRRSLISSPGITRGMTSPTPRFNRMPSVTSMTELIDVFGSLLSKRKDEALSTLSDLEKAVSRVADLENHVKSLRDTHTNLETSISEAEINIKEISEKLEEKEASIVDLEGTVAELKCEVGAVERSYEELRGEVAEYIEETKAPLVEITAELSQLDMQRIRKVLARAPLSALQVLFECSVFLLGATDMSMKAVKHATHDNTFCKKLAAVCVPGLNSTQISVLNEKLEQIKMSNDHMARVSDIGGVLLTYMRTLIFYWHRHHEDIQPRQARVEALKDNSKQLQVEIATKERLIRGLKEDITTLNATTKKEEGKMISLKGRKMDVEEELERVLAVINELKAHAHRWGEAIEKQQLLLEQVTGQSLLKAACVVYLTDLTPVERQNFIEKWEKDLVGRGLLKQPIEKTDSLKLVSKPGDLQQDVQAFVDHYAASLGCLLLRDPHHLVEEYLSGGVWIGTETDRWKEEVKDRLDRGENRLIYLWAPHSRAHELVKGSETYLGKGNEEEDRKEKRKAKIIVIMDGECSEFYCPLCSTHTLLNLTLDYKGAVHQFLRAILKWHSPSLEEKVQKSVRNVAEAQAKNEKAEEDLIKTFINSKKITDTKELEGFTNLVRVLNEAMTKVTDTETHLKDVTCQVSEKYLRASRYITRLYQVTHLVSPLNASYSVPISLLLENLAHKVSKLSVCDGEDLGKETDEGKQKQELHEAASATVMELLDTRLHLKHRLPVCTCLALANLDTENLGEDYVTSFLIPLDRGRDIWWKAKKKVEEKEEIQQKEEDESATEREEEEGEEEMKEEDIAKEEEEEKDIGEEGAEEEEEEEEIEEDDSEDEQEQEEFGLAWMPNDCDDKVKRVFERLTSGCSSLFPLPVSEGLSEEEVGCHLLKWLEAEDDAPSPSHLFCVEEEFKKASQEVLLARHLRPDLLMSAMKKLVDMVLPPSMLLEQNSAMLSRALNQHWRPKITRRNGISDVIQVQVGRGTQPLHDLLTAAKKAGLPYYKLTFLSMATASQQELRRRVVMAARRKTWLVLLDCEVMPDSLWSIHAALKLLPSTLSAPTVICLMAKGLHTPEEINSSVVVHLEIPTTLSANLATHLQLGYDYLQAHNAPTGSNSGRRQAALLITAYIFSLLKTRRMYGRNCWTARPLLTQAIFKESLSAAHRLNETYSGKVPWETLGALLSKVTYGSIVTSTLDQNIIDRIFTDHLNDKSYFIPAKQLKVHRQASVVGTLTPDGTADQPGPTGEEPDRGSPIATIPTPDLLGTSVVSHTHTFEAQGSILLYSFPEKKLMLDLKLPPQQAIEEVLEVAEVTEAQLLGLSEHYRRLHCHQDLTDCLDVFTTTPWVRVPRQAVMRMLRGLQSGLPGLLGPRAALVVKEEDAETFAWQQEMEIWDEVQENMSYQLLQIKEALTSGCARPAEALLALSDLVRESFLDPDNCLTSEGDLGCDVRQAAKDNLIAICIARTVARDVQLLSEEWKARHLHLQSWAVNELSPAVVQLGMMKMPGWWLTRLRQAVCTKAHWLLQGSLVYAVPSKPHEDERPNQGAYVSGGNLVGGRWYKDKVYPDSPNEPNLPITFAVTVSHAMKPTPVGCAWVPVLEKRRSQKPLFLALLPLHSSVASTRSPLHVILH